MVHFFKIKEIYLYSLNEYIPITTNQQITANQYNKI